MMREGDFGAQSPPLALSPKGGVRPMRAALGGSLLTAPLFIPGE